MAAKYVRGISRPTTTTTTRVLELAIVMCSAPTKLASSVGDWLAPSHGASKTPHKYQDSERKCRAAGGPQREHVRRWQWRSPWCAAKAQLRIGSLGLLLWRRHPRDRLPPQPLKPQLLLTLLVKCNKSHRDQRGTMGV